MYDDRNDCASNESCWEFDGSFLEESLESAPENDYNTCCANHTKIWPKIPALRFLNSKLDNILKRRKRDREQYIAIITSIEMLPNKSALNIVYILPFLFFQVVKSLSICINFSGLFSSILCSNSTT